MTDTGLDAAVSFAERIRAAAEELIIPITLAAGGDLWMMGAPDEHGVRAPEEIRTVSIGVATIPQHGTVLAAAMKAADEALYAAKAGGRNQVRAAPVVPPERERAGA